MDPPPCPICGRPSEDVTDDCNGRPKYGNVLWQCTACMWVFDIADVDETKKVNPNW